MPKFIAVVGRRNAGKSTIIMSLTGCPLRKYRDYVEDFETGRSIFVSCGSPQEQELEEEELQEILDGVLAAANCEGIVMAIQPTNPRVRLSLEEIVVEALERRFEVFVFVIDPGREDDASISKEVVSRLAQFRITPLTLDGRRFALLNAQVINRLTRLVDEEG